jgi:hypothetical protein
MYKIIGADGREYGPIDANQLRQWIAEGRANAQTKAQAAGTTEWKSLSEFSEFADALGASAGAPPVTGAVNAEQLAADIIARGYKVEIGNCLNRGWGLVKTNFGLLVGASFLLFLISLGLGFIPILGAIANLVIYGPLLGGLYFLYLKRIRGRDASVGDLFAGFSMAFLPLMLAYIVMTVLTGIGILLCLIPGIYLIVAWLFTLPLIIDRRIDFWPAMELSRKVVTKNWWNIFGLGIVLFLVAVAGVLACGIGLLVTIPIATAALMYAYEDIFGSTPTQTTG